MLLFSLVITDSAFLYEKFPIFCIAGAERLYVGKISASPPEGLTFPERISATPSIPYEPGAPIQRIASISASSLRSPISTAEALLIRTITLSLHSFARAIISFSLVVRARGSSAPSPATIPPGR